MARTVLITDYAWPSLDIERDILGQVDADLLVAETGEPEELVELAGRGVDAIMTNWKRLPAEALDAAPDCLVVARYGIGVDNIPVARATELGILVANVPDFCLDEVADHTMALLLACARRIVAFAESSRAGRWELELGRGMPRLRGQTLGLIGFGNTAQALVPRAQGFGMRVLAYARTERPAPAGVELTQDLDRVFAEADYVSLHLPATDDTRGLVGEPQLRAMKESAYLLNTSRGALVDEAALERALRDGWIAGAGLDVLSAEPPPPDHPLLGLDNATVTPHAAFYSETSQEEVEAKAARVVASVFRGEVPPTVVNPQVLESDALRIAR
jgi:D-3-phosphoglycerate dehydrogenase / 2-oxoglutarate reductase